MKLFSQDSEPKVPLAWIALLRIVVGVMILSTWYPNVLHGFYTPDGLQKFLTVDFPQADNPLVWYARFVEGMILPIRQVFAPLQLVAEFVLALALVVGAFTPLASLAGIFLLLNIMLATYASGWHWPYLLPIAILVVTLFTHAGRALGVDAYLIKRFGKRHFLLW
jgi:uncharacterized membrane protein YphA (DoxX/SURF4 family)